MVQWPEWVVCTARCPNPIRSWPIDFVVPNLKSASPKLLKTILKSSKSVHCRQRYAHFLYFGVPVWKGPPKWGCRGDKIWTPTFSHTMITTRLENTEKSISARKSYGNTCHTTLIGTKVPQGSVLGPLLYVLFTADVLELREELVLGFSNMRMTLRHTGTAMRLKRCTLSLSS